MNNSPRQVHLKTSPSMESTWMRSHPLEPLEIHVHRWRVRIRIRQSFRGVCHVRDDVILTSSIRICEMDVESTCRSVLGSPPATYITHPLHNAHIIVSWIATPMTRWSSALAVASKMSLGVMLHSWWTSNGGKGTVGKVFPARFSRCYLDR